jgi:hypothetical protein
MFDPDTPATGVGGNGTNSFLHWFQDGLTSDTTQIQIGGPTGKVVFPLVNALHINAIQPYVYVSVPDLLLCVQKLHLLSSPPMIVANRDLQRVKRIATYKCCSIPQG